MWSAVGVTRVGPSVMNRVVFRFSATARPPDLLGVGVAEGVGVELNGGTVLGVFSFFSFVSLGRLTTVVPGVG